MEPIAEVLALLERQAELEGGMHQPGGGTLDSVPGPWIGIC